MFPCSKINTFVFGNVAKINYLCVMKKCEYCGVLFIDNTRNKNKKYCNSKCYKNSKLNRQKKLLFKSCKICGSEFTPKSNRQLCCSELCSYENDKINNARTMENRDKNGQVRSMQKRRLKNKENNKCLECGNERLENTKYCEEHYYKMLTYKAMGSEVFWRELRDKFFNQKGLCFYTGDKLTHGINSSIDHIIPKSSKDERVYTIDNLVWCTREVNLAKRHTSLDDFITLCKKITIACGDVGVSQVNEAGTVSGRSLRS